VPSSRCPSATAMRSWSTISTRWTWVGPRPRSRSRKGR
jgi:hypothetical protein